VIARIWSARTIEPLNHEYLIHFRASVLPKLRALDGYVGALVFDRSAHDEKKILVITLWRSFEVIREFVGAEDIDAAVVSEEAAALLADFDRQVRHFELLMVDPAEGHLISTGGSS